MSALKYLKYRPLATAAACGALVAIALVFIPLEYERTAGHDVALALTGPGVNDDVVASVAKDLKLAIGGAEVRVGLRLSHGRAAHNAAVAEAPNPASATKVFTLSTSCDSRSRRDVEQAATRVASTLAERGIGTSVRVTPRVERVSGNVYAAAGENVIRLNVARDGRSEGQMEDDIRAQLQEAGCVENANVDVTLNGDQTTIQIGAQCSPEDCPPGTCEETCQLELQLQGDDGSVKPIMIRKTAGMTDADIKALIEQQLRDQGVEGDVSVSCETQEEGKQECRIEVKVEK